MSAGSARAQDGFGFGMKVIWTPDYTTNPPAQVASTMGDIGGPGRVHISFPVPTLPQGEVFLGSVVHALSIQEDAQHYAPIAIEPDQGFTAQWSPICGDPDPNDPNSPRMLYFDTGFDVPVAFHNGPHTILAVVQYHTLTSVDDPATAHTYTSQTVTLHVSVNNLIITPGSPSNPTPIKWDPDAAPPGPITATVSAGYTANQTIKLEIFTSDQALVKTYSQTLKIPGPVSFTWDGTSDNPMLYGEAQAPPMAKGIYLFKWSTGIGQVLDGDSDKSEYLGFGDPPDDLVVLDGGQDGQKVRLSQTLIDSNGVQPSTCRVNVYQRWDLVDILQAPTQALLGTTNTTLQVRTIGQASPGDQAAGTGLNYLISPVDGDSSSDKGHRNRPALQHNYFSKVNTILTWGGMFPKGTFGEKAEFELPATIPIAEKADPLVHTLAGYQLMSFRGPREKGEFSTVPDPYPNDPSPDQIIHNRVFLPGSRPGAPSIECSAGVMAQCVDVAILCGHGRPNNFLFGLATGPNELVNPYHDLSSTEGNVYEVADSNSNWINQDPGGNPAGGACYIGLTSLDYHLWGHLRHRNNTPVSFVLWMACESGKNGFTNSVSIPQATVEYLGAKCSAAPKNKWTVSDAATFMDTFATSRMQGYGDKELLYNGLKAATNAAVVGHAEGLRNGDAWMDHLAVAPSPDAAKFALP